MTYDQLINGADAHRDGVDVIAAFMDVSTPTETISRLACLPVAVDMDDDEAIIEWRRQYATGHAVRSGSLRRFTARADGSWTGRRLEGLTSAK